MSEAVALAVLLAQVKLLTKAVKQDESGQLIGQMWVGGNGGLLSIDTLVLNDHVARLVESYELAYAGSENRHPGDSGTQEREVVD
jgi:hypothetical protein